MKYNVYIEKNIGEFYRWFTNDMDLTHRENEPAVETSSGYKAWVNFGEITKTVRHSQKAMRPPKFNS